MLGGVNFDSAELSDTKKVDTYIKCAEAYLEVRLCLSVYILHSCAHHVSW